MKKLITLAASLLIALSLNASERNILSVVSPDSLDVFLRTYLEQTTGKRFEDPVIPRFLITDRKDLFVFGVGGYVGAKMFFDYEGNDNPGFSPMDPSLTAHQNETFNLDMTSTRFFFKVLGNTNAGIAEAYIEAGFSGNSKTLSLKKAYLNILGFRVGLSLTAFADNQTVPVLCDDAVTSFNDRNVPMIAYSYLFNNGLRLQGGFEFPQSTTIFMAENPLDERQVVSVNMPRPDYVLSSYLDQGNLHLYAGATVRIMQFYDKYNTNTFKNIPGYAFNISGNYKIASSPSVSHRIYLQAQYENRLGDSFNTLQGKGLTAIMPNRIGWTEFDYTYGFGAQIGYSISFGQNSVNIQANGNNIFGHENSGLPDLYKKGCTFTANYMRNFFKYGTIGAEAVYGRSYTVGGNILADYRVVGLLRYNF